MIRLIQVILILVACLFLGCASQKPAKRPAAEIGTIKNFEQMNEEFEPTTLPDDDIRIEDVNVTQTSSEDVTDNPDLAAEDSIVTGYRIQLFQTEDAEEAKNIQKDAILRFNHDVYRVFDPPFYKVRVGDFLNWYDAEKLQKLAIQKGYHEAWVIRTKINLRKATKWMEDLQ
jgi:hypothetical protein